MQKNGLRASFRQKSIIKIIAKSTRKVIFPESQSIHNVGFIADFELREEMIVREFQQKIEWKAFTIRADRRIKGDQSGDVFSSDLNFFGIPPKHLIQQFVDIPFDILINFSSSPNDVVDYICATSGAKFKVSKYQNLAIYDLIINQPDISNPNYMKEIIKTLNNFSN